MSGKQPINLRFNFDTGEIRGKLGEINSLIQKVVAKGKNNEFALKISGIEVLQDRLKQIDSSVQALAMRFANMHQSVDFSSEIDKNAKAIVQMDAQMERSMASLQNARKNRNKTADTFFGQVNTKRNISEIMDGADLEALSQKAGSNFSQIVEQIVLASSTVDGLNKQIQLTEDKSVSLQEVFNKIVSSISGTSIQDFFGDGNFSMERVQGFIDEFSNKLSNMKLNFTPALQEAFKNMFSSDVLNSQANVLQEEFGKAVEKQKAGQIKVNIDEESINKLASAIGQLEAVIGEGEGKKISFGINAEDIEPITQAINDLGQTINNIHNLLNQFDIPKIRTDGIDDVKNKLDEARQSAEKFKEEESRPSDSNGWNTEQIQSTIGLLEELRDGLKTISEGNSQEAITQRFTDMGTEISAVVLKLGELKSAFESIDFNMTIKTNGNPIQQNVDIARAKRDAIDIYREYRDELVKKSDENANVLLRKHDADGRNYYGAISDAADLLADFKPKSGSASALYDYYSEMVNKLKQLFSEAGIDISSISSQFEPQLSEVNNKIRNIGDTGKQVEQTLRNVFGGNLNVENNLNIDKLNESMIELKTILEQIQQILSTGLGVDMNQQGPMFTYFDKLLLKIKEVNEAINNISKNNASEIDNVKNKVDDTAKSATELNEQLDKADSDKGRLARIDIHKDSAGKEEYRTETYKKTTDAGYVTTKEHQKPGDDGKNVVTSIDESTDIEKAASDAEKAQIRLEKAIDSTNATLNKYKHNAEELNKDLLNGIKLPDEEIEKLKTEYEEILDLIEKTRSAHATDGNLSKVESTDIDNAIKSFKDNIDIARQNQRVSTKMEADTPELFAERWKTATESLRRDMQASKADTAELEKELDKLIANFDDGKKEASYFKNQNAEYKKIQQKFYNKQDQYDYEDAEVKQAQAALKNYEKAVDELSKAKQKLDNPDGTRSKSGLIEDLENAQKAADLAKQKLDELRTAFDKDILSAGDKSAFSDRLMAADSVYKDPTTGRPYQLKKEQIVGNMQKEMESFEKQYNDFINNTSGKFFGDRYDESVENMKAQMQQLLSLGIDVERVDLIDADDISRARELLDTMKETMKLANKDAGMLEANSGARSGLLKNIGTYLAKNTRLSDGRRSELQSLYGELQGNVTVQRLDEIKTKFNEISAAASVAGETGRSFADTLTSSFRNLSRYLLSFASFYRIIGTFKQAVGIVKELDSALMEVRKVSTEPLTELREWQKATFNQGDAVGGSAAQIQRSTASWLRLGKTFTEAQEAAQASVKLLNVSEFENIDDATTSLVSMRQAFKDLSYEDFIDKLNGVGDNFSSSTDQLAYGMKNVSSVLKVAGNDIDQSLALLTAANDVTQDMSKASMGVRTVALRISGTQEAKQELEDMGEDVSDFVVQTQSKVDEQVRKYTATAENPNGISVLDSNGRLRSTYDILVDISKVYDDIVAKDNEFGTNTSNALLELLAGKTRSNILASILQNPDVLQESYEQSKNSQGVGQRELDIYLDSVEAKLAKLQNRLQELASVTIDSGWLKGLIDFGTGAIRVITQLSKAFGGLNLAIGVAASVFLQKSGYGLFKYDRKNGFSSILDNIAKNKLPTNQKQDTGVDKLNKDSAKDTAANVAKETTEQIENAQPVAQVVPNIPKQDVKEAVEDMGNVMENTVDAKHIGEDVGKNIGDGVADGIEQSCENINPVNNIQDNVNTSEDVKVNVPVVQQGDNKPIRETGEEINYAAGEAERGAGAFSKLASGIASVASAALTSMAVSAAISLVTKGLSLFWTEVVKAEETAIKRGKEAQQTIAEIKQDFDNKDTFVTSKNGEESSVDKYLKLREGVSITAESGIQNVSLSNEEYEEFLSLNQQIAELFPKLVGTFDANGNAILNLSDDVDTATNSFKELIEQQRFLSEYDIGENLSNATKGAATQIEQATERMELYSSQEKNLRAVRDMFSDFNGNYDLDSIDLGKVGLSDDFTTFSMTEYTEETADYVQRLIEIYRNAWEEAGVIVQGQEEFNPLTETYAANFFTDLSSIEITPEQLNDFKEAYKKQMTDLVENELSGDIFEDMLKSQAADSEIKATWNSIVPTLLSQMDLYDSYRKLGDSTIGKQLQQIISDDIANMDYMSLTSEQKKSFKTEPREFLRERFLDPIIKALDPNFTGKLSSEVMQKISDVMFDTDSTRAEWQNKIADLSKELFPDDKQMQQNFRIALGVTYVNEDGKELFTGTDKLQSLADITGINWRDLRNTLGTDEIEFALQLSDEGNFDFEGSTAEELLEYIENIREAQEKAKEIKKDGSLSDIFGAEGYSDKAEGYEKALSSLSSALQDLQNNGKLTAETMRDLQEQFPNLTDFSKEGIQKAAQTELSGWIKEVSKSWEDLSPQGIKQLTTYVQNLATSYGELGVSADDAKEAVKNSIVTATGTDVTSLGERKRQLEQYEQAIDNLKNYYGEENINWEVVWMLALEDRFSDPAADIYAEYNDAVIKWEIQVEYEQTKKDIEKNIQNIQAQRALVESRGSRRNAAGLSEDNYDELLALDDQAIEEYTNSVENTYEARIQSAKDTLEQAEKDWEDAYSRHDLKGIGDANKTITKARAEIEWLEQNKAEIDKENIEAQTNLENSVTQKFQDELGKAQVPLKGMTRTLNEVQNEASKTQNEITELENKGLHGTEEQYNRLMTNADTQLLVLESQKKEWETLMSDKGSIYERYGYNYKESEQYISDLQEIANIESQIVQIRADKENWKLQPLTNELTDYQNAYSDLQADAVKIQDDITEAESKHLKLSDKVYQDLIDNGDKQIKNMRDQQKTLRNLQREVEYGGTKWRDYQSQIESLDSSITSMQADQVGWFETMSSSVSTNATSLASVLSSAFSEINSGTGLTIDTINELKRQFSDIAGVDVSSLFYETADGMKFNVAAAEELVDAEYQLQQANLQEIISTNEKIAADQNATASAREQAEARIQAAQRELSMLQALYDEQKKQFSRLAKFQQAQQSENGGANFETMQGYLKTQNENRKKGLTGTDEFKAYTEYFDRWGLNTIQAWDRNKDKIERYLTDDVQGVINFMDDLVEKGFGTKEGGNYNLDLPSVEDAAAAMGMSVEWVRDMFGRAEDYGLQNDWVESQLDGHLKIKEAIQDQIREQLKYNQMLKEGASQTELEEQAQEVQYATDRINNINQELENFEDHTGEISESQIQSAISAIASIKQQYEEAKEAGLSDDDLQGYIDSAQEIAKNNYLKFKGEVTDLEIDDEQLQKDFPGIKLKVEPDWSDFNKPSNYNEELVGLAEEQAKIEDWGLTEFGNAYDTSGNSFIQHQFGNVDMDKRVIVTWSDELKQTYKDALDSWKDENGLGYNPEVGAIDTVFGGSGRFGEDFIQNGVEVAYSAITQKTDGGFEFLSQDAVYDYVERCVQQAAQDGFTEGKLLAIDADRAHGGLGIIMGADTSLNYENNGNKAETYGRLAHFSGKYGAISLAQQEIGYTENIHPEEWYTEGQKLQQVWEDNNEQLTGYVNQLNELGLSYEELENIDLNDDQYDKSNEKLVEAEKILDNINTLLGSNTEEAQQLVSALDTADLLTGESSSQYYKTPTREMSQEEAMSMFKETKLGQIISGKLNEVYENAEYEQKVSDYQPIVDGQDTVNNTVTSGFSEVNGHLGAIASTLNVSKDTQNTGLDHPDTTVHGQMVADQAHASQNADTSSKASVDVELNDNEFAEQIDADIQKVDELDSKSANPSINLDGQMFIQQVQAANQQLDELNSKNVNPMANIDGSAFVSQANAASSRLDQLSQKDTKMSINLDGSNFVAQVDAAQSKIDELSDEDITVSINLDGQNFVDQANAANEELNQLKDQSVSTTINLDGQAFVAQTNDAQSRLDAINEKTVEPTLSANNSDLVSKTDDARARISALDSMSANPSVNVTGNASSMISSIESSLNSLNGKEVVTRIVTEHVDRKSGLGGINNNVALACGNAFAGGKDNDDLPINYNGGTLVGEEAPEMHVSRDGGYWQLVGQNGPEFRDDIAPGDIVFNAEQTRKLLRNGHTNRRGKALAGGTQPLHGPAFAGNGLTDQNSTMGSIQFNHAGDQVKQAANAVKDATKSTKAATAAKDKETDAVEEATSNLDKFSQYVGSLYDWIEVKISRWTHKMELAIKRAENIGGTGKTGYVAKNAEIDEAMAANNTLLDTNKRGEKRYMKQASTIMKKAKKFGLVNNKQTKKYTKLIQNGAISIEELESVFKKNTKGQDTSKSESKIKTVIDAYTTW